MIYVVSGWLRSGMSMMCHSLSAGGMDVDLGAAEDVSGRVIKRVRDSVLRLPAREYRVVYMLRDAEEIRQSMQAFLGITLEPDVADRIDSENRRIVGILQVRRDMSVTLAFYRDVIAHPVSFFSYLKTRKWPIDPEKSASAVDERRCRFKRENLVAGA